MKQTKTVLALVLAFVMLFALTACGNAEKNTEDTQASPSVDSSVTTETPTEENTEPSTQAPEETTEPTEEPATDATFDTSWASNEFEKLIPQPPFTGWTAKQTDDSTYEMEAAGVNAPDYDGSYYETFEAYAKSLETYGFKVTGEFNQFTAKDEAGNLIRLRCGDGYAWITIIKRAP